MTTKLQLFRDALRICGAASIATLVDEIEGRRLLDEVWDNGGVRKCLERGAWKFAVRTQMLDYDPSISPAFGFTRAFLKGSDWVTTTAICNDEFLRSPLLNYVDEVGYLYANEDIIYVQFVSDDAAFGGDLSTWTGTFSDFAAAYFASQIIHRLTASAQLVTMLLGPDMSGERRGYLVEKLRTARSKDGMQGPTRFLPTGAWTRSRSNGRNPGNGGRRDGGPWGQLIG